MVCSQPGRPRLLARSAAGWVERERRFAAHRYANVPGPTFQMHGQITSASAVFTAVHGVETIRDGARKMADLGTAGLAEWMAIDCGFSAIVLLNGETPSQSMAVQSLVGKIVAPGYVVIDLHGMQDQRGLDIEIGLGDRPCRDAWQKAADLAKAFETFGLNVAVNEVFRARRPDSVVNIVSAAGATGLQLEIAARCRPPLADLERMGRLVLALNHGATRWARVQG